MNKEALQKRYNHLWMGETAASILSIVVLMRLVDSSGASWLEWIARTYSIGIVIIILLQGIVWWRWKLTLLKREERDMPPHVVNTYRRLRRINWVLIGSFFVVVPFTMWLLQQPILSIDMGVGVLILGFAVLEQINYYYYQLMYDSRYDWRHLRTTRRLRRGNIAKALDSMDAKKTAHLSHTNA